MDSISYQDQISCSCYVHGIVHVEVRGGDKDHPNWITLILRGVDGAGETKINVRGHESLKDCTIPVTITSR